MYKLVDLLPGFVKIHVRDGADTIMGATTVARHAGEKVGHEDDLHPQVCALHDVGEEEGVIERQLGL